MKIEFDGRTWEFDQAEITNKQAEKIRVHTGMSVSKWIESIKDTDADDWESRWDSLYWLMLQQNPQHGDASVPIADVDYPVYKFVDAYMKAYLADNPAEAEPDPTLPAADSELSPGPASRKGSGRGGGVTPDG